MELVIKDKLQDQLRDCFQIEVKFMFGDCDGEETLLFDFSSEKYNNTEYFKETVHDFIRSIQGAIKMDSLGRRGFNSSVEALEWYGLGIDDAWVNGNFVKKQVHTPVYKWSKFCEDFYYGSEYEEIDNETLFTLDEYDENSPFAYGIPTYEDGWCGSYEDIRVFYYDKDGYKYNVDIL